MFSLLVYVALLPLVEGNCEFCSTGIVNDTLMLPEFLNLLDSLSTCANLTTIDTEPLDKFACAGLQSFQNYCCPGDGVYACGFCSNGLDNPEAFLSEKNVTCSEYQHRANFADEEKCDEDFKPMENICCSENNEPPAVTMPPSKDGKENQCVFCSNGMINDTLVMPDFLNLPATISTCAKLNAIDTEPLDKFACAGLLAFQNYCCPGNDVYACGFCSSGLDNPDEIVPSRNESCSQFQYRAVFAEEEQCEEDYKPMESICCSSISSTTMKRTRPLIGLTLTFLSVLVGFSLV